MKPTALFPLSHALALALTCLAFTISSRASVIATDDFDSYTLAEVISQNGGTGWDTNGWLLQNSTYSAATTIVNSPVEFAYASGGVVRGGNKALKITASNNSDRYLTRAVATERQLTGAARADVFVSFIFYMEKDGSTPGESVAGTHFSAWGALRSGAVSSNNDAMGLINGTKITARVNGSTNADITTALKYKTPYFLVIKYIWDADTQRYSSCQAWLNPTVNDEATTSTAITRKTSVAAATPTDSFGGIHVRSWFTASEGRYQLIDDIRIGTTWEDVVGVPTLLPPTVTSISPLTGLYPGDTITIIGTNFADETAVTIGGYPATKVLDAATPSTKMTVTIPNDAIGDTLEVVVRNGTDSVTAADTINVAPLPPVVTSVTPDPAFPGGSITIAGTNLSNATVTIGTETAIVTANTATSITVTIPDDMTAGGYTVTVTTPAGSATGSVTLSTEPTVTSVVPARAAPGELITLTGAFLDNATVTIGGVPATVYGSASTRNALKVFVPDGVADGTIIVTTPGGIVTLTDQFEPGSAGVLLASDDFSSDVYTTGSATWISTKDGGIGWGEPWKGVSNSYSVVEAPEMTYTLNDGTVVGSGKALKLAAANNNAVARAIDPAAARPIAGASAAEQDIFMSYIFMINRTADPDDADLSGNLFSSWGATTNTGLTNYDTANAGTAILIGFGGKVAARVKGASNTDSSFADPLKNRKIYFAVVKYTGWINGHYTKCQVWLNPNVEDESSSDALVARTATNTSGGSIGFSGFGVRTVGLNSSTYQLISAIRIGTSWSSVVSIAQPVVADISPINAHPGDVVTISGGGLNGLQRVTIGGKNMEIQSATNAAIKIFIPVDSVGANQEIVLKYANGDIVPAEKLNVTLTAPVIDTISYTGQTVARDQTITIRGRHFTGHEYVKIAGIDASLVIPVSNTEIKVKVPMTAPAGLANVEVKTIGGTASQPNVFTVDTAMKPPPILQKVEFDYATVKPGDQVTLLGENFAQPATVKINGIAAQIVSLVDGEIVFTVPEGVSTTGNTTITVETGGGITTSQSLAWTYSTMPVITLQPPETQIAVSGSTRYVNLVTSATATSDLAYQWQFLDATTNIWRPVSNNNSATSNMIGLSVTGITGVQVRCAVSTRLGKIYTNTTTLKLMDDLLAAPAGIAISDGIDYKIYVSDTTRHTIQTIDTSGSVGLLAGLGGSSGTTNGTGTAARFNKPHGLTIDNDGIILVADSGNNAIRAVTDTGEVLTTGTGVDAVFVTPAGLAALDTINGATYIADTGNHLIKKITTTGEVTIVAGSGTAGAIDGPLLASAFNAPASVAVDVTGNYIYVADTQNHAIRLIDLATSTVNTFAGEPGVAGINDGDALATAHFNAPGDLAVDETGRVFVADTGNSRIRVIMPDQSNNLHVYTVAGNITGYKDGTSLDAWFRNPSSLALKDGNLYVADTGNGVIRKIALGNPTTVTTLEVHGAPLEDPPPPDTMPHGFPNDGGGGGAPSLWFIMGIAVLAAARHVCRRK